MTFVVCWYSLQTVWTFCWSWSVSKLFDALIVTITPERIFENDYFEKKSAGDNKSMQIVIKQQTEYITMTNTMNPDQTAPEQSDLGT